MCKQATPSTYTMCKQGLPLSKRNIFNESATVLIIYEKKVYISYKSPLDIFSNLAMNCIEEEENLLSVIQKRIFKIPVGQKWVSGWQIYTKAISSLSLPYDTLPPLSALRTSEQVSSFDWCIMMVHFSPHIAPHILLLIEPLISASEPTGLMVYLILSSDFSSDFSSDLSSGKPWASEWALNWWFISPHIAAHISPHRTSSEPTHMRGSMRGNMSSLDWRFISPHIAGLHPPYKRPVKLPAQNIWVPQPYLTFKYSSTPIL